MSYSQTIPMTHCAVSYARVSSKDQEREGFSIPAQLDLLRPYGAARSFRIAEEFVDVEIAKQAGRAAFGAMVAFARKHRGRLIVLVEKTDRLYRNPHDWVTIDELDVEIHLVKENVILSPESRSHEKFMHGIKVLMAKNRRGRPRRGSCCGLWSRSTGGRRRPLTYRLKPPFGEVREAKGA